MKTFSVLAMVGFLLTSSVGAKETPKIRDGQWETTITMEMSNMPAAIPPITQTHCVRNEDLAKNIMMPPGPSAEHCKILQQKATATRIEWEITCADIEGSPNMRGKGEMSFKQESYEGKMTMSITYPGQGEMEMKYIMRGKRLGDCPATESKPKANKTP